MKKQSRKYLWWIMAVLVILVGAKVVSSSASPQIDPVVDVELTISESRWDFGDVSMSEGVTTKTISLTNDSTTPVTITNLETSCMCTAAQIVHLDGSKSGLKGMVGHGGGTSGLSETVQAGETITVLINFDPNAHGPNGTGPITRTITMKTNSQSQSEIELSFSGNVIK